MHIWKRSDWIEAQSLGAYKTDSLETEGFIHCSKATQVIAVANFIFRGQRDLVLLGIDGDKVVVEIRHESGNSSQNDELPDDKLYPHIHGPLNVDAVTQVVGFNPLPDGTFELPEIFR